MPSESATSTARRAMTDLTGLRYLRSRQWATRDRTFWDCRSLQMQMMGTLLFLIILMSSAMPERSPAPMPSTSSMMMTRFFSALSFLLPFFFPPPPPPPPPPPKFNTLDPVTSPSPSLRLFFDRASEALSSRKSRPDSRATRVAVVVLPMPGGPERRAAFLGPAGAPEENFLSEGRLKVSSHLFSQTTNLRTNSRFPSTSSLLEGAYLSAQRAVLSPGSARPPPAVDAAAPDADDDDFLA
mmetsp:Transcript_1862/g.4125  ORF Transcript_1862/g.4125 Transcript_1862/m.4125 type:complete len:240 (+) Transcript_1862:1213-1932(+)